MKWRKESAGGAAKTALLGRIHVVGPCEVAANKNGPGVDRQATANLA
jgi:hypothetical protein